MVQVGDRSRNTDRVALIAVEVVLVKKFTVADYDERMRPTRAQKLVEINDLARVTIFIFHGRRHRIRGTSREVKGRRRNLDRMVRKKFPIVGF